MGDTQIRDLTTFTQTLDTSITTAFRLAACVRLRVTAWPLHNIAITNSEWCMAYKGGGGL